MATANQFWCEVVLPAVGPASALDRVQVRYDEVQPGDQIPFLQDPVCAAPLPAH